MNNPSVQMAGYFQLSGVFLLHLLGQSSHRLQISAACSLELPTNGTSYKHRMCFVVTIFFYSTLWSRFHHVAALSINFLFYSWRQTWTPFASGLSTTQVPRIAVPSIWSRGQCLLCWTWRRPLHCKVKVHPQQSILCCDSHTVSYSCSPNFMRPFKPSH